MGVQENLEIVKAGYAAFGRGDLPGLLALLSEDVEWIIPGEGTPLAGNYRGHSGVAKFFQTLASTTDILDFQPREFVADGDRVLVIGFESSKVKATGRPVETNWVMAFTVRNGKVVAFREYGDTQAWANAFGAGARAAG